MKTWGEGHPPTTGASALPPAPAAPCATWAAPAGSASCCAMLPLGPEGIRRRLYAAVRQDDLSQPYMAHVLRLSRTEPLRMLRGPAA